MLIISISYFKVSKPRKSFLLWGHKKQYTFVPSNNDDIQ